METTAMNRVRSPKYPNFSLRQAVKQAEKIFRADRRNTINRADAVAHMGYSGLSGPADKSLATLVQYGLLERVGKGEVRVSNTMFEILHPEGPQQRAEALAKAAYSPEVFKAIRARFPEGASPESLRSFLVREDFMDRAIDPIMKAFTDTAAYLKQEGASDSGGGAIFGEAESELPDDADEDVSVYGGAGVGDLVQWESQGALQLEKPTRVRAVSPDGLWVALEGSTTGIPMDQVIVQERAAASPPAPPRFPMEQVKPPAPPFDGEPYRVSLTRGAVEGEFRLRSLSDADELIEALNAFKLLLKPLKDAIE